MVVVVVVVVGPAVHLCPAVSPPGPVFSEGPADPGRGVVVVVFSAATASAFIVSV